MTILRVGVHRTPDMTETEWQGNRCYVDRYPQYNVFIPRMLPNERLHTTIMTGASPDVREILKQTAVIYVADTGQYLEDLPENPTGMRVAFIHEPITNERYVTCEVRTGVDWEILVERQTFTYWDSIEATHPPITYQTVINNVLALPEDLERSSIYNVVNLNHIEMYFTGSSSFDRCENITIENLYGQIKAAQDAYSNIVRLDTIQQMQLVKTTLHRSSLFVIADASSSETVDSGMAIYSYDHPNDVITKIYEEEGSDLVFHLGRVTDSPASAEMFDSLAFTKHEHSINALPTMTALITDDNSDLVYNDVPLTNGFPMHLREW